MNNNELFIEVSTLPHPLSKEETLKLLEKVKNGSKEAREQMVIHNIRLVLHVVLKYFSQVNYDKKDLVSVGNIGLLKAIDTYDISKGVTFSTYATRCIEIEILSFLRNLKELKYEESINKAIFYNKIGRAITYEDILFDDTNFVEDYENVETIKTIGELISQLPEREQEIVKLYFGFYNNQPSSQQEIADIFHISRQRIGKIITETVKKIGEQLKAIENNDTHRKVRVKRG